MKTNKSLDLKELKVLIASHVTHGFGCAQAIEKFLTPEVNALSVITHPLYSTQDFRSTGRFFQKGKLSLEVLGPRLTRPETLRYVKDVVYTFLWGWKRGIKYDVFIGMNCLVSLSGILLKWSGRVKKVIYYTADYSGRRFQNRVMNKIYDLFDLFAVRFSDMVWNVSGKIEARRWQQGASQRKTMVVPNTVDFECVPLPHELKQERRNNLVYVGGLNEGYGLEELIDLVPWILSTFPDLQIDIIGGGILEGKIRQMASQAGVLERIQFHGYMPYNKALAFLAESSVGFAPYTENLDPEHYLRYCDPSKVKAYMACGCTVIIRNVPELAHKIREREAGWVYETKEELKNTLYEVFSNPLKREKMQKNAYQLAREFENKKVFSDAFQETLERWSLE